MRTAAKTLEFEEAARLRDRIKELRRQQIFKICGNNSSDELWRRVGRADPSQGLSGNRSDGELRRLRDLNDLVARPKGHAYGD